MFKKDMFKCYMSLSKEFELLGNKFNYDMYGKCNQQERKVYPQIKYYEHKISHHEFCSYKAVVKTSERNVKSQSL
jgi:hypothetical protein